MRIEEFLQLEQGSMIVMEYEKKFIELSKYFALLVADEKKKCQLFTRGLRPAISDIVVSQRIMDYGVLVVSATLVESSQKAVWGLGDSRRRQFDSGGPSQGSSKRGNFSSGSSGSGGHRVFRARAGSNSGSIQSFSCRTRDRTRSKFRFGIRTKPCACLTPGELRAFSEGVPMLFHDRATVLGLIFMGGAQSGGQTTAHTIGALSSSETQASTASRESTQQRGRSRATGKVLIDLRATHSFVAHSFAQYASVRPTILRGELAITLPMGEVFVTNTVYMNSPVLMGEVVLEANLIPLEIVDLNVI
ncbi:uncharacterized protein LOC18768791 [Prunus persica]|uniref:uncharacterized protein LOC18768791 n=1 Tax=Prunus persica TaxID=3760 RepID=UPI0009AB5ACE|nr:uncharacterized protein LOC18768791 [Prunus persica]